jgi:hypothetical protein
MSTDGDHIELLFLGHKFSRKKRGRGWRYRGFVAANKNVGFKALNRTRSS